MKANRARAALYELLSRVASVSEAEGFARGRSSLLSEIEAKVGIQAAAQLARDFGGRRVYIPASPSWRDQIIRSIGIRAAIRLAHLFGGDRVVIPAHPDRSLRREQIMILRRRGISVSTIARSLGCTERYVYRVLSAKRED